MSLLAPRRPTRVLHVGDGGIVATGVVVEPCPHAQELDVGRPAAKRRVEGRERCIGIARLLIRVDQALDDLRVARLGGER